MSSTRFYQIIENTRFGRFIARKSLVVENTDPSRFYLESFRDFFGVSKPFAKRICDRAVRSGLFIEHCGLLCPVHRQIIAEYDPIKKVVIDEIHRDKADESEEEMDESLVRCNVCYGLGALKASYHVDELERIVHYSLSSKVEVK